MPSTEQISERVSKVGEDTVQIEEGLGESYVLDLDSAEQRLENLTGQKDSFANQEVWQKKVDVTKRAIAMLRGE